jgi:uncharacterized membrane protein
MTTTPASSVFQSYGYDARLRFSRLLAGTPNVVAAINIVVVGVLAALIADTLGASDAVDVAVGIIAALIVAIGFGILASRMINTVRRAYRPRFPRR